MECSSTLAGAYVLQARGTGPFIGISNFLTTVADPTAA